jgi:hypothetical protein
MARWLFYMALAWRDVSRLWRATYHQVVIVAGICLPILLLLGLKHGHVEELRRELVTSPSGRQVIFWSAQQGELLNEPVLERLADEVAATATIIPETQRVVRLEALGNSSSMPLDDESLVTLYSTAPGDPILGQFAADVLLADEKAVVLTEACAAQLGLDTGSKTQLTVYRRRDGLEESHQLTVAVKAIVPSQGGSQRSGYANASFLAHLEQYVRGNAVPELDLPAMAGLVPPDEYSSYLLFCQRGQQTQLTADDFDFLTERALSWREVSDPQLKSLFGVLDAARMNELVVYELRPFAAADGTPGILRISPLFISENTQAVDDFVLRWNPPAQVTIDNVPATLIGLTLPTLQQTGGWIRDYLIPGLEPFDFETSAALPQQLRAVSTVSNAATGNPATGNAATGNAATGNTATGNTATGNTATGNTAIVERQVTLRSKTSVIQLVQTPSELAAETLLDDPEAFDPESSTAETPNSGIPAVETPIVETPAVETPAAPDLSEAEEAILDGESNAGSCTQDLSALKDQLEQALDEFAVSAPADTSPLAAEPGSATASESAPSATAAPVNLYLAPANFFSWLWQADAGRIAYDVTTGRFVAKPDPILFDKARLYTRTIDDVPTAVEQLSERGYAVLSESNRISEIQSQDHSLQTLVLLVSIGVFLFGTFTVVSVLVDATDRKRGTIGILRVMGMSRSGIFMVVVLRALVIGVLAAVLSVLLGAGLAYTLSPSAAQASLLGRGLLPRISIVFEARDYLLVAAGALLCSGLGAIVPAWRASKLDPFDAIVEGKFH